MNVRVLIGPAGSGKTHRCIAALRECERQGRRALLLVPDQFTYAADRLLLEGGDLRGTRFVRVLSFRRLAHLVAAEAGGPPVISEQGRRMLLRAVVHATPLAELGPLASVRETTGLIVALAAVLKEVKGIAGRDAAGRLEQATASPAGAERRERTAGVSAPEPAGRAAAADPKVRALARLIAGYDAAIDTAGLADPEERIHAAARWIDAHPEPWRARPVWIDGFAGFRPEDKTLIEALARASAGVTIGMCADAGEAQALLADAARARSRGAWTSPGDFLAARRATLQRPAFLPTLRTLLWLQETFGERLALEGLPSCPRFRASAALARLEAGLFHPAPPADRSAAPDATTGDVSLLRAAHPHEEVAAWARLIDRWTRLDAQPARYRDVAVIVRDLDAYRPLVLEIFGRYGIPVFIDERRDATAHPLLRLALAALQLAARGWTREAVIGMLRNPYLGVPADTADRIELLSTEYGVEYERWWETDWEVFDLPARDRLEVTSEAPDEASEYGGGSGDWDSDASASLGDLDTLGDAGEDSDSDDGPLPEKLGGAVETTDPKRRRGELAAVEARAVAARLFPSWRAFCESWQGGPVAFEVGARALRRLLWEALAAGDPGGAGHAGDRREPDGAGRACDRRDPGGVGDTHLAGLPELACGRALPTWSDEETRRIAALLEELLDDGARLMGPAPVDAAAFARLLRDALAQASIGQTPRHLDTVVVAEPRRARINETPRVILGGLDSGAYPRVNVQDPLFSDAERERLAGRGLPMAYTAAQQAEEDPYLFYVACSRATERLVVSYPARGGDGRESEPSPYVVEIAHALGRTPSDALAEEPARALESCQHPAELAVRLARTLADLTGSPPAWEQAAAACREQLDVEAGAVETALACAERMGRDLPEQLDPQLAVERFADGAIATSVSRLETFVRCPFQYFARFVLGLEPRPEPVLTPRSTGSAAHDALQRFFKEALPSEPGRRIDTGPLADPGEISRRMGRIFAALAGDEAYRVFQVDPPSAYRWDRTRRALEFFLRAELARMRDAAFQPVAFELAFGGEGGAGPDPGAPRPALARGERPDMPLLPAVEIDLAREDLQAIGLPADRRWRLRLRGRIDRLDVRVATGAPPAALVIDYKHSRRSTSVHKEILQGLNLQVGVYLIAVERLLGLTPAAGLYYGYTPQPRSIERPEKPGNPLGFHLQGVCAADAAAEIDASGAFFTPGREPHPQAVAPERLAGLLARTEEQVRAVGLELLRGRIRAHPVWSGQGLPCERCDYVRICRFDARRHPVRIAEPREAGHD